MKLSPMQGPCHGAVRVAVLIAIAALTPVVLAQSTTINFENLSAGQVAGDSVPGMTITTCDIPYDVAVGDLLTPTHLADGFWVVADPNAAVSETNYIIPRDEIALDLLIKFDTPVIRVKLYADRFYSEPHNLLRLIAVQETTQAGTYQVLESVEAWDDLLERVENDHPPGNWMAVTGGGVPFTTIIFQAQTELEGIDDLSFTPEGNTPDTNNDASTGIPPDLPVTPPVDANTPPDSNVPVDSNAAPDPNAASPGTPTPAVALGLCPAGAVSTVAALLAGLWLTRRRVVNSD